MEQNFQTSFIPKKPIVEDIKKPSRPISFFMVVALLVFLSMLIAVGGFYFYKQILAQDIVKMEANLYTAKNRFEPEKISQLTILNKRINAANTVLNRHVSVSPIFEALSAITLKTVRYTRFSYEKGTAKDDRIVVKLNGQATGYRTIALQSDLLATNKNFINPIFSNLTLDPKGNVLFDLEFSVDANFVNYKNTLERNPVDLAPALNTNI